MLTRWYNFKFFVLFPVLLVVCSSFLFRGDQHVYAATIITNPGFETGDLSGWTVVGGDAFSAGDVTSDEEYWNKQAYDHHNLWHVRSGNGDNNKTGEMQSETFTLGGDGQIDFLIGGGQNIDTLYVALFRASDNAELFRETGPGTDTYSRVSWDASAYTDTVVYFKVVDSSTSGHINVDDFNVPPTPSLHDHVEPALYNHDFEYTTLVPNEIKAWKATGEAFEPSSLTHETHWSEGDFFHHGGNYHLWNFKDGGDGQTGVLRSETFMLDGNGGIDFLIGGGQDIDNLYVALVRASDGAVLFKETGRNTEKYQRVFWDGSDYLGEDVYIEIVDQATGGWGHINADDFHVYNSIYAGGLIGHWKLDETLGSTALEEVTGTSDPVSYHLNEGRYQPSQDPLWKADGIDGGALLFDGYSTWITRTPDQISVPREAITVEAWVAPRNFEHGEEGRLSAIVSQQDREANEGFVFGHYRHGRWGLRFGTGNAWREVMSDTLLPLNEWSYVTATYDSASGEAVLYLNGEKVASRNFPAGETIEPSVTDLLIGKNNQGMWLYGYTLNMYSGLLDELKIHNRALTATEVSQAYDQYMMALGGNVPTADLRMDRDILAEDRHRPQFHAGPPLHWQNEPGGPIYFNGQYHVFYQSNPRGPYWNHIRWGHLVSDDMVHWRDADDAVIPGRHDIDPDGAWAGDAVIDDNGVPVIFYTAGDNRDFPNQRINIARSTYPEDGDNDLNRWEKNDEVILEQQEGQGIMGEFRDPFVFKDGNTWFMLVTSGVEDATGPVGGTALVYSTQDPAMEDWVYQGELYVGDYDKYPLTGRVWELPILLPLGDSGKHIFLINPAKMEREEYQSRYTFYWIGTWDPATATFTPDNEEPQLLDVGEHFTGPAGFVTPDGRSVIYSVTQGRRTALQDYDAGYAHNFGLPVEVYLRTDGRLGIKPIDELQSLRGQLLVDIATDTSFADANAVLSNVQGDRLEIELELDPGLANEAGISLRRTPGGEEETTVYYKRSSKEFWVNRTRSSLDPDVEKWFQGGTVDIGSENIRMHIYVDRSMIETYLNDLKGLTTRAYPTRSDATGFKLWANSDTDSVTVKSLKVWEMESAYPDVPPTGVSLAPYTLELIEGQSDRLTPTVTPADATNKDIKWTSSDPQVATVTNGQVRAHSPGTATITVETREGGYTDSTTLTVVDEPAHTGLINHDFEEGSLSGWTIVSGEAFSELDVTKANDWGWGGPFRHQGDYHLYSLDDGDDSQVGHLRSHRFTLGGNGQIDFLVSGGDNIYDLKVALVRASDGEILMKTSGGNRERYRRVNWDAKEYVGTKLYIEVIDNHTGDWGHINIDDINVPVDPVQQSTITNPGFETGDLAGWSITSGDAFGAGDVSSANDWGWGCCFEHGGNYHLWSFQDGGDAQTGVLRSETFTLSGSGWIDFLIGGGQDMGNLYVALVRENNGEILFKATGYDQEKYTRVYWDASDYAGEDVYIELVDQATGDWGHINADDFHVNNMQDEIRTADRYEESRPQFHYSPEQNWMNDPNGLVYYDGEYHLFYQYNPFGETWGPMHWGHAVSTDLVNWQELPIALEPDMNGYIWSGSVVVDWNNTAGFGEEAMVAVFTHEKGGAQSQSLAYSLDKGRTWTKYDQNPVLPNSAGHPVFRDPKVFWHEDTGKWIMVLAVENDSQEQFVRIYTSPDLKNWTFASDFGKTEGSHAGVWEMPDLFELPVGGDSANTKWVMQVSLSDGASAGGSGIQYFVGEFDGTMFTNDHDAQTVLYSDHGADYYAALTFQDMPATDDRTVSVGWMNNWSYGQSIPTSIWRGAMAAPRELALTDIPGVGIRLQQKSVDELTSLRGSQTSWTNETIDDSSNLLQGMSGVKYEIEAEFQVDTATAGSFEFRLRQGSNEQTVVGYDIVNEKAFVDRSGSGDTFFNDSFGARHETKAAPVDGKIKLRMLVDRSSIEVFVNDGRKVFTEQIFPNLSSTGMELYAFDGEVTVNQLDVWQLSEADIAK